MSMENFSTKGQVNLWGKEASLSTSIWRGWAWGMLGQGLPDPPGQQRRAPHGAQVGGEGGWSGGRDSSVPPPPGPSPCPKNSQGQAWRREGWVRGKKEMLQEAARSPVSIVHVCKEGCGHKHSYGGLLLSSLNVGEHSCDTPPPDPWAPKESGLATREWPFSPSPGWR